MNTHGYRKSQKTKKQNRKCSVVNPLGFFALPEVCDAPVGTYRRARTQLRSIAQGLTTSVKWRRSYKQPTQMQKHLRNF